MIPFCCDTYEKLVKVAIFPILEKYESLAVVELKYNALS